MKICTPLIFLSVLLLLSNCKEEYNLEKLPQVTLVSITKIKSDQWELKAQIEVVDNRIVQDFNITAKGFQLTDTLTKAIKEIPAFELAFKSDTIDNNPKREFFEGLADNTTLTEESEYRIRAFIEIKGERIYSSLLGETLNPIRISSSYTEKENQVSMFGRISGTVEGDLIEEYGHCWVSLETPQESFPSFDLSTTDINVERTQFSNGEEFEVTLPFEVETHHYIKPYAKINGRYYYGEGDERKQIFIGNIWRQLSPLTNNCNSDFTPINCLVSGVGFSIGKKGYIGTGERFLSSGTNLLNTLFWSYDVETATWTRLSGNMRYPGAARTDAVAFVINGEAFVVGGRARTTEYKDVYRFREGEGWSRMDDIPLYLRSAVAFTIDDKAYVGTGFRCDDGDERGTRDCYYSSRFWEFDPSAPRGQQWRVLARCKEAMSEASGFSIGDKGYVSGGVNPNGYITTSWEFDPKGGELDSDGKSLGEWTKIARFPGSVRQKAVGFSLNGKGYIGTGSSIGEEGSLSNLYDFFEYDSEKNIWTQVTGIGLNNRDSATPFVIKDEIKGDRAYVYGGFIYRNFQTVANDFWRYTPEDE